MRRIRRRWSRAVAAGRPLRRSLRGTRRRRPAADRPRACRPPIRLLPLRPPHGPPARAERHPPLTTFELKSVSVCVCACVCMPLLTVCVAWVVRTHDDESVHRAQVLHEGRPRLLEPLQRLVSSLPRSDRADGCDSRSLRSRVRVSLLRSEQARHPCYSYEVAGRCGYLELLGCAGRHDPGILESVQQLHLGRGDRLQERSARGRRRAPARRRLRARPCTYTDTYRYVQCTTQSRIGHAVTCSCGDLT